MARIVAEVSDIESAQLAVALPMALKWTLAWACLSLARAEEDAACMLQAHRAVEDTKPFCPAGTKSTFDFLKKKHGDIIKPNSIPKVTITVTPRKNPSSCTGPAMILDTRGPPGANPTPDGDLATCPDCAMLIYSQDGNTNNVNDCGEQSGPRFRFDFLKLEDLETILLWDLDEGTTRIRLYNDNGNMIGNILVPNTANGAGITVNLLTKNVRRMDVLLGGSGGIVSLTGCKQVGGSIFGDPHIYTLDGGKFDLYENGTFSVFHLTGLEPHVPKTAAGPHKGSVDWQLYAHYGGRAFFILSLSLSLSLRWLLAYVKQPSPHRRYLCTGRVDLRSMRTSMDCSGPPLGGPLHGCLSPVDGADNQGFRGYSV